MLVKVSNGEIEQYPYTLGELRRDNPNVSFPKNMPTHVLEDFGVYRVSALDAPSINERTESLRQHTVPTLQDGSWVLGWDVVQKTQSQIDDYDQGRAESNRARRNQMLSATDFLALTDNTLSDEMAAYRQALRDITAHPNWPYLEPADWPTPPS